jgi:predicted Zn finger-like uncharacterized protein
MNLTCPSCDSTFRIDPGQIGPSGRQVRCGSCGHEWKQPQASEEEAPSEAPAEAPVDAPAEAPAEPELRAPEPELEPPGEEMPAAPPSAPRRRAARTSVKPPPRASGRRIAAGWVFFFVVAGALAAGAYFGKAQIVAAVPAAAELYRLAGMPVEPRIGEGLELRDVKSVRRLVDGQRVVVIEGTIANVSEMPRDVPQLRASVTDPSGAEVDQWIFSANSTSLPPGGETQFETSTRNAPREGSLGIDFVAAK